MRKRLTAAILLLFAAACMLGRSLSGFSAPGNADMIGGLKSLPRITVEEAEALPMPRGTVHVTMNGVQLPYDAASNTYFVPQHADGGFVGTLELEKQPGWEYFLCAYAGVDKQTAIRDSIGYQIYGVSEDKCVMSRLIFTSLPALCLTTESGELPQTDKENGRLAVFTPDGSVLRLDETAIQINLRGNTSKRFPKNSYRVTIIDKNGEKQDLSIAGLRSDDDWILNPLYTDTSKIREWLAYELWNTMNSSGAYAASSRMSYAELFINGEYWGLYGVQERIDRKQVDGSKQSGILYKMLTNERPTVEDLQTCTDAEFCEGIRLDYAGAGIENPWEPALAYMAFLEQKTVDTASRIALNNAIDYGLWAMLIQAHDCHFKNQFVNCVYENGGHAMYKIPWDLNNTFGDVWSNDDASANHTDHFVSSLVHDSVFETLLALDNPAILQRIKARWTQLRESSIRIETMLEPAKALHERLLPAIGRDDRRWPESGMGEGNLYDMSDVEAFLELNLPQMDAYIESL